MSLLQPSIIFGGYGIETSLKESIVTATSETVCSQATIGANVLKRGSCLFVRSHFVCSNVGSNLRFRFRLGGTDGVANGVNASDSTPLTVSAQEDIKFEYWGMLQELSPGAFFMVSLSEFIGAVGPGGDAGAGPGTILHQQIDQTVTLVDTTRDLVCKVGCFWSAGGDSVSHLGTFIGLLHPFGRIAE